MTSNNSIEQQQLPLQQRRSLENDYGITSMMDESNSINSSSSSAIIMNKQRMNSNSGSSSSSSSNTYDKNWVVPKVKSLSSQQQQQHFRMIVCGDSGK
jgi:hypothetical protein